MCNYTSKMSLIHVKYKLYMTNCINVYSPLSCSEPIRMLLCYPAWVYVVQQQSIWDSSKNCLLHLNKMKYIFSEACDGEKCNIELCEMRYRDLGQQYIIIRSEANFIHTSAFDRN